MLQTFAALQQSFSESSLAATTLASEHADRLVVGALAFIGILHEGAGFVDCALGVVVGLDGLPILVDGAVALAGAVVDPANLDVAPDLDPLGVAVAAEGVAE